MRMTTLGGHLIMVTPTNNEASLGENDDEPSGLACCQIAVAGEALAHAAQGEDLPTRHPPEQELTKLIWVARVRTMDALLPWGGDSGGGTIVAGQA